MKKIAGLSFQNKILFVQGVYYLLTGIWPLVHLQSFLFVTGGKTDLWLLKTFAIILACIGITFCLSGAQAYKNIPVLFLSLTSAGCLMYVDAYYAFTKTISPVYLADAFVELVLFLFILFTIKSTYKRNFKKVVINNPKV